MIWVKIEIVLFFSQWWIEQFYWCPVQFRYHCYRHSEAIFSCDQAALRTLQSVRLSLRLCVRPSVTPFSLCFHHRIIIKFSGVIANDRSDVHARVRGQRSKVKVTEVKTQFIRFRTVTPAWIHICIWNDAQSLKYHKRSALLLFKVMCEISRSHG